MTGVEPDQLALHLGHRPAMGAADLVITAGNRLAVGWIDRWPDWPVAGLALSGPPGSGKSHLARVFLARTGGAPVAADALSSADLPALVASTPALAVDDAAALAGLPAGERALLHLFNLAADGGRKLLLIGREPPARWPIGLPDLASRLATMASVAVQSPDDAALAAVMGKLFRDRQVSQGQAVIPFLLARMERSFGAANELVAWLDQTSLARRCPVSLPLAREALAACSPVSRLGLD